MKNIVFTTFKYNKMIRKSYYNIIKPTLRNKSFNHFTNKQIKSNCNAMIHSIYYRKLYNNYNIRFFNSYLNDCIIL